MAFKVSKLQLLRGFLARRIMLRVFLLISAIAIFPFLQFVSNVDMEALFHMNTSRCEFYWNYPGWYFKPISEMPLLRCKENVNFTSGMFSKLMEMKLLYSGAKVLCVGEGSVPAVSTMRELGFFDAIGVDRSPFSFLLRKGFIYDLSFGDGSFDFVFSRALDKVSIPALFVLEIERVLKPGGIGAMLMSAASSDPGSLIKTATPLSSFLKSSVVIHVRSIESFTLVVFKKRGDDFSSFEHYRLPDECLSVMNNKPFIKRLEPLVEERLVGTEERFSYLPKFMNISSQNQLVYIDIGAGEFINSSIASWFIPIYPMQSLPFNIYALDHNKSVMASYVGKPGITFIHYPGLAGKWATADLDPVLELGSPSNDALQGFDFLVWFKETVAKGNFVILKMNARGVGFKLLHELFESGAICLIDELFLHCSNSTDDQDATGGDCFRLFKALRSGGVYVHQWMGD